MRVQQVPNSPYFIHYDDEGFAVYPKAEKARTYPESEMQAFLGAVANGLLYIEKGTKEQIPAHRRGRKQLLPKAKRKAKKISCSPR